MIYDVDVVAVPEEAVVGLRGAASRDEIGRLTRRLRELVAQAGLTQAGPAMARFHGSDPNDARLDCEVCLPVRPSADGAVPDRVAEAAGEWVPLHHALQAVHTGPRDSIGDAWRAVLEACDALGYTPAGPLTEVYVSGDDAATAPAGTVTRVRLPYAR